MIGRHHTGQLHITVLEAEYGEKNVQLLHGALSAKKRQANLDHFESGSRFLIANKACAGYSLNLQFSHIGIYYNNDWDWATRQQSEDRLHRNGQENVVDIINICASKKIDERILASIEEKENMTVEFKRLLKAKNLSYLMEWIDGKDMDNDKNWVA